MDQDISNKSKQLAKETFEKAKNITTNILTWNVMMANIMIEKFYHKFYAKNKT